MIQSVTMQNLRGVRSGTLGELSPLSILVGPNNCGKSTCLEAISIVGHGSNAADALRMLLRRGGPPLEAPRNIATDGADRSTVSVRLARTDSWTSATTSVRFGGTEDPSWHEAANRQGLVDPCSFLSLSWEIAGPKGEEVRDGRALAYVDHRGMVSGALLVDGEAFLPWNSQLVDVAAVRNESALEDAYTEIDRTQELDTVVAALRTSLPDLQTLKILKSGDHYLLHLFFPSRPPVPAYVAGDGFKRLLRIAAAGCQVKSGVLLLEEPEAYQHPRYLGELAELLLRRASGDRQIILSTHSIELIDHLLAKAGERQAPFPTVHRLRLMDGKLSSVALTREQASQAREALLEDLRA